MEIDTAVRHKIPVVVVISNNGGWTADAPWTRPLPKPGRNLGHTRYDRMAMELGAHGEFVEKPHDIRPALERAFASGKPAVVNVITDSQGARHDRALLRLHHVRGRRAVPPGPASSCARPPRPSPRPARSWCASEPPSLNRGELLGRQGRRRRPSPGGGECAGEVVEGR